MSFIDSVLKSFQDESINEKSKVTFQEFFNNYFYFKSYKQHAEKIKLFLYKQGYYIDELEKVFRGDLEGEYYKLLIEKKINHEQYYVMKNINRDFAEFYDLLSKNDFKIDVKDGLLLGDTFNSAYFRGNQYNDSFILCKINENDSAETHKIYDFSRSIYGNDVNVFEKRYHYDAWNNYINIEIKKQAKEILKYVNSLPEKELNLGIVVLDQGDNYVSYLFEKQWDNRGKLIFYLGVEEYGIKISKFDYERLKICKSQSQRTILNKLFKLLRKNTCVILDKFNFIEVTDNIKYLKLLNDKKIYFDSLKR